MRNLTRIALLGALALAGCDDNGGPALKVVVGSNFGPLTEVRVRMFTPRGDMIEEALFDVGYEGLPFSFSVVPPDPEESPHVILTLEAVGSDYMTAFERHVQFSGQVSEGQTLYVYLAAQCETLQCGDGKTCSELGCVDPWVADADMGHVKDGAELEGLDCEPGTSWCRAGGEAVERCGAFGQGPEYIECASNEVCGGTPASCVPDGTQNNNNNNLPDGKVNLHIVVTGDGYGSVVSFDRSMSCDGECTFEVAKGTEVQLLSEPGGNDYFVGWNQACGGAGDCWLNLEFETWVEARFEANGTVVYHRIDVAQQGNGSGRVYDQAGTIDCGGSHTTCYADVSHGMNLEMIAEPDSGSVFVGWEGICWGVSDTRCNFTVESPVTLMPRFVPRPTGPARFDVDGDGFGDLVYAAPGASYDGAMPNAGSVYVRKGPIGPTYAWANDAEYRWDGGTANEELGRAFVVADVSDDGIDDVVIGAPGNQNKKGAVYAVFGGPGLIGSQSLRNHQEVIYGQRPGELFGAALTARADLDGDDKPDIVVGAPGNETMPGRVYVFLSGSFSQGPPQPALVITGEQPGDQFGWSVESAGDLDGDGSDELLVGAPRFSVTGLPEVGRAYLFKFDTSLSRAAEADGIVTGAQPRGMLGFAVTGLGDWQGDSTPEWAVSLHVNDQVLVFSGFTTRQHVTPVAADHRLMGTGFFGAALGGFEDYDGDGRPDLVVGGPISDPGSQGGTSGLVRVFVGGGPTSSPAFQIDGSSMGLDECSDEGVGYTVGPIADLDLDGTLELGVGTRYGGGNSGPMGHGRVLVYDVDDPGRPVNVGTYDARWLVEGEHQEAAMCASLSGGHAYWPNAADPSLP